MDTTNLIAWLSFDNSISEDKCGNRWTAYGNPTISKTNAINGNALQLDGTSYIEGINVVPIELFNADFTIHFWMTYNDSKTKEGGFFTTSSNIGWQVYNSKARFNANCTINGSNRWLEIDSANLSEFKNSQHHFAIVRKDNTLYFFFDGTLKRTYTVGAFTGSGSELLIGARGNYRTAMTMDEFMIHSEALWTENFTPPTAFDYARLALALDGQAPLSFQFDIERKIIVPYQFTADVEVVIRNKWRYWNAGDANDLIVESTILTDLPKSKSLTGTAFYQTGRAKCFDLPATHDIWAKFEVYFDGSNRWRAFNGGDNSNPYNVGITAQAGGGGDLSLVQNSAVKQNTSSICKTNQLQTVLLHMVSGTSGLIEAWVDGEKIYTYTGDVNHGQDFNDFYLQSDGAGTFFSNVIISNTEIHLGEGWLDLPFDTEIQIQKSVEVIFAVQRKTVFAEPIIVPFIGEHFNHFVESVSLIGSVPQPIILPKNSSVYIRGVGAGAFKIFTDTANDGQTVNNPLIPAKIQADIENECETVFIKSVPTMATPQQVIKAFIYWLDKTTNASGTAALNGAVNFCTNGTIPYKETLVDNFLQDLADSASYTDFLSNCCDIILGNDDTGAITGYDAGGALTQQDGFDIVPEQTHWYDDEWEAPAAGSTTTIEGLTVHYPTKSFNGSNTFTYLEQYILAGLNSEWIKQGLKLVKKSLGIDFNTEGASVHDIKVFFEYDNNSNTTAYVQSLYTGAYASQLNLFINLYYWESADSGDDGLTDSGEFLDRTITHELTHAVMAVNICRYSFLPLYITEGMAELVHGIDDLRSETIVELLTARTSDLERIFSKGGNASDGADVYAAGYLFLRYLAKQGSSAVIYPDETVITKLLISDGAIDSECEALTDNTRQIFYPDVSRTLKKTLSPIFDVAILDVIPVEVNLDVKRNILAKLKLFATDNSTYLSSGGGNDTVSSGGGNNTVSGGSSLPPVVIPNQELHPAIGDTKGLQSIEISISEQQITDQVHFTGVIPFDIMQQISGQYLDYKYNMRVESVRQTGILYSCECCSDIDELLYSQIDYTVPKTTAWREVGTDNEETVIKTFYPPASTHVQSIANTLGLSPVIQFEDFLSTVLKADVGGATFADVIRDIFGWSSRIPTQLINVFINDGKLYVVQRGYEANNIDISDTKHTMPTITRNIVRTTYGSKPYSKTETREVEKFSGYDITDNTEEEEEEEEEESWFTVSDFSYGTNWHATTTYYYPSHGKNSGLLVKVDISKYYSDNSADDSYTQISHSYDDDGTKIRTETDVYFRGSTPNLKTINSLRYITLPNGEKYLATESTVQYEEDLNAFVPGTMKLVDAITTTHSPSRRGQTHVVKITSDSIAGEACGQDTGDDRVTPYAQYTSGKLIQAIQSTTITPGYKTIAEQRTVGGIALYDPNFPVHNVNKLIAITQELKRLNRMTKETLSMTIYNYPHLINFNDRITFEGKEYFLVSNAAKTTSDIVNEQNLTFVRWY